MRPFLLEFLFISALAAGASEAAAQGFLLCGQYSCEQVVQSLKLSCDLTWESGCGKGVPAPDGLELTSTITEMCPEQCGHQDSEAVKQAEKNTARAKEAAVAVPGGGDEEATAAPAGSTEMPGRTTAAPEGTTGAAPEQGTTAAPARSTAVPKQTTAAPRGTTGAAPEQETTAAPAVSTAVLEQTTAAAEGTTGAAPEQGTTAAPAGSTVVPKQTTAAPGGTTGAASEQDVCSTFSGNCGDGFDLKDNADSITCNHAGCDFKTCCQEVRSTMTQGSDANGCLVAAGQRWCEALGRCISHGEACMAEGPRTTATTTLPVQCQERARAVFHTADKDDNENLDANEFSQFLADTGMSPERVKTLLVRLDVAPYDGALQVQEFIAFACGIPLTTTSDCGQGPALPDGEMALTTTPATTSGEMGLGAKLLFSGAVDSAFLAFARGLARTTTEKTTPAPTLAPTLAAQTTNLMTTTGTAEASSSSSSDSSNMVALWTLLGLCLLCFCAALCMGVLTYVLAGQQQATKSRSAALSENDDDDSSREHLLEVRQPPQKLQQDPPPQIPELPGTRPIVESFPVAPSFPVATTVPAHLRRKTCPAGHFLMDWVTPMPNVGCNICGASLPKGALMSGCRACDFDVCAMCIERYASTADKGMSSLPSAAPVMGPGEYYHHSHHSHHSGHHDHGSHHDHRHGTGVAVLPPQPRMLPGPQADQYPARLPPFATRR